MVERAPLVVSLWMDDAAWARLDTMRRDHFPAERNVLPAHLTLFHALPAERLAEVDAALRDVCGSRGALPLEAAGPMRLGKGVAVRVEGNGLAKVRTELAERFVGAFGEEMTGQDRGGSRGKFRGHVTVQNKVTPGEAAALYGRLRAGWEPFPVTGEGLALWRYRGGPWELVKRHRFGGVRVVG